MRITDIKNQFDRQSSTVLQQHKDHFRNGLALGRKLIYEFIKIAQMRSDFQSIGSVGMKMGNQETDQTAS